MQYYPPPGPQTPNAAPPPPPYPPPGAAPVPPSYPASGTAPVPPQHPPGAVPYSYGAPPSGPPQSGPTKPKGGARRKVGIALLLVGVLPLLLGIGIEANNFRNAQQQVPNNDFVPKAWHNMESDEIFPDYLTNTNTSAVQKIRGWSRQGIAREASCEEALLEDFKEAAKDAGCKTVLLATYVDSSGSMAATVGLIVIDSPKGARLLGGQYSSTTDQGPLVRPVGFPKTAGDDWVAVAGATKYQHTDDVSPYLLAVSIGTTEASRSSGELPEPWTDQERYENERWISIGAHLLRSFDGAFSTAMREDR